MDMSTMDSHEADAEPSSDSTQARRPLCEEMDTDAPTDLGPAFSREGADVIKDPEKRLFTSWLDKPTPGCLIREVSGCKRCGLEVTIFIAALFSGHLQGLALLARGASNDPRAHLLRLAVASFARLTGPDQLCICLDDWRSKLSATLHTHGCAAWSRRLATQLCWSLPT